MLYRIGVFNEKIGEEIKEKKKTDPEWDWREDYLLLGSDVKNTVRDCWLKFATGLKNDHW